MLRKVTIAYLLVSVTLVLISLVTGRRASNLTGEDHYLFTATHQYVKERVAPANATDSALDAAFREAGESTDVSVERPMFVLGFLDATGPLVVGGGLVLAATWVIVRRRRAGCQGAKMGQWHGPV